MSRWGRRLGNGLRYTSALAGAWLADRRRLRALTATLGAAAAAYRRGGLPAWAESLEVSAADAGLRGRPERTLALADAIAAVRRTPPFRYCMRRSALRYVALRAAGQAPRLVIGIERASAAPGLDGHAWVEVAGQPFREEDDRPRRLTAVFEVPPRAGAKGARAA